MSKHSIECRLTKRPLGKILVDGEFATNHDLEISLREQGQTNKLMGEILVLMGVLEPPELEAVLSIQRDLACLKDAVQTVAGVRQLLGTLLIQAKRITPEQLDLAIKEQQRTGERIGEILVRKGLITVHELKAMLEFQHHQGQPPKANRLRLGELLVAANLITREQLEDALRKQQLSPHMKIGEILVESGYAKPHHISFALKLQRKLLTAVLVAVLSLAHLGSPLVSLTESATARGKMNITARVLASISLKMLYQMPEIVVTHADVLRGYIEVPSATRIEIRGNTAFLLNFEGLSAPFKEVYVKGLRNDVLITADGGFISISAPQEQVTLEVSYRFILLKDVQPGTYSWPLMISITPE